MVQRTPEGDAIEVVITFADDKKNTDEYEDLSYAMRLQQKFDQEDDEDEDENDDCK